MQQLAPIAKCCNCGDGDCSAEFVPLIIYAYYFHKLAFQLAVRENRTADVCGPLKLGAAPINVERVQQLFQAVGLRLTDMDITREFRLNGKVAVPLREVCGWYAKYKSPNGVVSAHRSPFPSFAPNVYASVDYRVELILIIISTS